MKEEDKFMIIKQVKLKEIRRQNLWIEYLRVVKKRIALFL
jgi:hypothetical protein